MDLRPGKEKRRDRGAVKARTGQKTYYYSCNGACAVNKHGSSEEATRCMQLKQRQNTDNNQKVD